MAAIPQLSDAIFSASQADLAQLNGFAADPLQSGLVKINFYELVLALILESEPTTTAQVAG
jgi:hypothetical protein